jgi:hypothetical protein
MFGLLLIFAHSRWAKRRTLRGMLRRSPALTAHREVIATPDGLRLITATSDLRFAWSYYQSAVDDGLGVTMVVQGGTAVHLVPRRALADADEESAWAQRVKTWVADASGPVEAWPQTSTNGGFF